MPILGSFNSTENKDNDVKYIYMDKIWGYTYLVDLKTLWEKEKLLLTSNFSFSHDVFNAVCCRCVKMSIYGLKGKEVISGKPDCDEGHWGG